MKKVYIDEERCKGCGLCISVCPKKVLGISSETINSKGFAPASVCSPEACIGCGFCAAICPDVVIRITEEVEG